MTDGGDDPGSAADTGDRPAPNARGPDVHAREGIGFRETAERALTLDRYVPADAPTDPAARAAVGLSGTYDLSWWGEATPPDVPRVRFLGGTPDELPDRYAAASPVTYVADAPPTLLAHGTDDEALPIADAAAYRDALRAAGRHVEFLAIDGGGHLFPFDEPGLSTTVDAVARFLRARL
jgi:acetyl esterase/lipase